MTFGLDESCLSVLNIFKSASRLVKAMTEVPPLQNAQVVKDLDNLLG